MQVVNLVPLSRAEIGEKKPTFLQKAMAGRVAKTTEYLIGDDLVDAVLTGGYPEMIQRRGRQRRGAWGRGYVNAIMEGDVRGIAGLEKMDQIPRLLKVLCHPSGQLTNLPPDCGANCVH